MLKLKKGSISNIEIAPLGFSSCVLIDITAFKAVKKAQSLLKPEIKLVITRAYQPESLFIKWARYFGARLFSLIYPARENEAEEIFGHNGHAIDGRHVDISIKYKGNLLILLPNSVFTNLQKIEKIKQKNSQVIADVRAALQNTGFSIHHNITESLQIHCDLIAH